MDTKKIVISLFTLKRWVRLVQYIVMSHTHLTAILYTIQCPDDWDIFIMYDLSEAARVSPSDKSSTRIIKSALFCPVTWSYISHRRSTQDIKSCKVQVLTAENLENARHVRSLNSHHVPTLICQ